VTADRSGFTVIEALGALAVSLVLLATVLLTFQPTLDEVSVVPEATDLHQRSRASEDVLRQALAPAGAGADLLGYATLTETVPAVWPRRLGRWSADVVPLAWADRLSVLTVPLLAPQAPMAAALLAGADQVAIAAHAACGIDPTCGFRRSQHVLVSDATGRTFAAQVADVAPGLIVLDQPAPMTLALPGFVTVTSLTVLYFDAARRQLRRYDGFASDQPLVDDVVWAAMRYYGDPLPPRYPAVAGQTTCVAEADGSPRLPFLGPAPAPLVELSAGALSDGPWCGGEPWLYDADLLRVRAIRVTLRLQAGSPAVRGVGPWFASPGVSRRPGGLVPDITIDLLIAPRALAGGG
jgi:hypothetical protein